MLNRTGRASKRGYTLGEILVVVLIISIIFAVAMPISDSLFLDIIMSHLNSSARAIYMSAQQDFAVLKSVGSFAHVIDLSSDAIGQKYLNVRDDVRLDSPTMLTEIAGGTAAIIEYTPESAIVSSVFFSKTLTAEELEKLYLSADLFDAAVRRKLRIGYYGGEPVGKLPPQHKLIPKIEVKNGEDLYLLITCDDITNTNDFEIEVTLSNIAGEITLKVYDFLPMPDGTFAGRILLDTMGPGDVAFAVKYPDIALYDVTAMARITYNGDSVETTSDEVMSKTSVTFSPLFESTDGFKIAVSRVRHLNNLRYILTSGYTVVQTEDIAFENIPDDEFYTGISRKVSLKTIPKFAGIFNGNNNLIKNLSLDCSDSDAALFGEVSGTVENVHLTGNSVIATDSAVVGTLCARLTSSGIIDNCSASEISINATDGATVGGLAGVCEGNITRSSSILDSIELGEGSRFGGIAGRLDGGTVMLSHSAGSAASGSGSVISGIANGSGYVENCYSELTSRYLAGSRFYGIGENTSELVISNCEFVRENAWLALDSELGSGVLNIDIIGFDTPKRAVIASVRSPAYSWLPESVSSGGVKCRYGKWEFPVPRGLIGVMTAHFDGEGYSYDLLHCFDAYDNNASFYPLIEWEEPYAGEMRIFVFRSDFASPAGVDGWSWTADGVFGEEFSVGGFICCEVSDPTSVTIRFKNVERTAEFEAEEGDTAEGCVGIFAVVYDGWAFDPSLEYQVTYRYFDLATGAEGWYELGNSVNGERLYDIEDFRFDAPDFAFYECRVYIFTTAGLKVDIDWSAEISPGGIVPVGVEWNGYTLYEFHSGEEEEYTVSVTLNAGGVKKRYLVDSVPDPSGLFAAVPSIVAIG